MPAAHAPLFDKCQRYTPLFDSSNFNGFVGLLCWTRRWYFLHIMFFFDDAFICSARDLLRPSGGGVASGFGVAGCLTTNFIHTSRMQTNDIIRLTRSTYASSLQPCFRFQSFVWASNKSLRSRLDRPSPNALSIKSENSMSYQY